MLCPKQTPKVALKTLYKQRWNIEVDLRTLKTTMGMEVLSCKTPQMNEKEIWIYFLAYNLIRWLMNQAALLADLTPRQISFKHTIQLWLAWLQRATSMDHNESQQKLLLLIVQRKVGNRPGRVEPRVVKRRPKAYPLLIKPRAEAREQVKRNGHPKKLK